MEEEEDVADSLLAAARATAAGVHTGKVAGAGTGAGAGAGGGWRQHAQHGQMPEGRLYTAAAHRRRHVLRRRPPRPMSPCPTAGPVLPRKEGR